jgi:hypothetical protein
VKNVTQDDLSALGLIGYAIGPVEIFARSVLFKQQQD